jgi:predicted GNAT superfamily acetyltransferase
MPEPLGYHAGGHTGEVRMVLAATAAADALAAATAAGVEVRELHDPAELRLVQRLFEEIWRPAPDNPPPVTAELLRALAHAGNYVTGAWAGERLAGACVGFYSCHPGVLGQAPAGQALHSHITGVAPGSQRGGVGFALKLHQRAWALARGLPLAVWTFDPLVARNAWFNLTKLGANASEYLPDFYGPMTDAINTGDASDRLLVAWRLDDPKVTAACAGSPAEPDPEALRAAGAQVALDQDADGLPVAGTAAAPVLLVRVPDDVEGLRASDPAAASRWRHAVREVLGGLLAEGAAVTGFARPGCYVLRKADG